MTTPGFTVASGGLSVLRRARTAIAICLALLILAVPSAAAAAVSDPSAEIDSIMSARGLNAPASPGGAPFWTSGGPIPASAASGVEVQDAETAATPPWMSLPEGTGCYYWVGDYLVMDGKVKNTEPTAVGPVRIYYSVKSLAGADIFQGANYAAVFDLAPGQYAALRGVVYLPDYAGQELAVTTYAAGLAPSIFPDAVDLTVVGKSMSFDANLGRVWAVTLKNESAFTVEAPIAGGWEYTASGEIGDSLVGVEGSLSVPPGGTFTMDVYGANRGGTPVTTEVYAQAVPVVPGSEPAPAVGKQLPIYRFYNIAAGSHFYTDSPAEVDLVNASWPDIFRFEGVAYYTNPATNVQRLFRFYHPSSGSHFYTASEDEAAMVKAKWSHLYIYDGPSYLVSPIQEWDSVAVYRFVNRKNSSHFYTASVAERDMVMSQLAGTYLYEGPAFWVAR